MDIQNFRLLQNFKNKEQEYDSILRKQHSTIQLLRKEYEDLKYKDKQEPSKAEKLIRKRNLRTIYTFKLPESKQKTVNEIEERYRYGWCQRPLSTFPPHVQKLYRKRNAMLELGNLYSKNNQRYPLVTKTISRASSVKTEEEMKYEMLKRGKELGNHYSFRYRKTHNRPPAQRKSFFYYKEHDRLINQKNEMEKDFANGEELPQQFTQKYVKTLNDIRRVEEVLDLKHKTCGGPICFKILQFDNSLNQDLLAELNRSSFEHKDGLKYNKIELKQAVDKIEIDKILNAMNTVERTVCNEFGDGENTSDVPLNQTDFVNSADKCNEDGFSLSSSEYFDVQQTEMKNHEESQLREKVSDSSIADMSKHYPSLENLLANQISTDEHAAYIKHDQQTDDTHESSQTICKSQSISALSSELCQKTSSVLDVEQLRAALTKYHKMFGEHSDDNNNNDDEYSISNEPWQNEDSFASKIMEYDTNDVDANVQEFNKLLLHV